MNTDQHHLDTSGDEHYGQHSSEQRPTPSRLLYISHFISTWNSRGFEFGAVLFLATIYPGTLLPMSIYALVRAAAAVLFSHQVGLYIDVAERLSVIRTSIVGSRISVISSCLTFLSLLCFTDPKAVYKRTFLFLLLVGLGCIEKLCSIMNLVAIERDWVIVIAGEQEDLLQEINSQMRRIDLLCKLGSPLAIALLDAISSKFAVTFVLLLNTTTVTAEYYFIAKVYRNTPSLADKHRHLVTGEITSIHDSRSCIQQYTNAGKRAAVSLSKAFQAYFQSTALLPSLALSLLYLTVLSFSGQMITFLLTVHEPKLTSATIGILRTISTIVEVSSTFIVPRLTSRVGNVRAGIWFLSWQLLWLTPGVAVLWRPDGLGTALSITIFIAAVIFSRVGLWSFDLVAQLHIQNSIEASHRGSFSSIEASLQNFFELCAFATTVVFSRPEQFRYPALLSLIATYIAAALYAAFVRHRRGHLVHMPCCIKTEHGRYQVVQDMAEAEVIELVER